MKRLLLGLLAACSTTQVGPGTGTVVYSEVDTGHVRALDVASGRDWLIDDGGAFGALAISSDGQHVAYVGADAVVRVAGIHGGVTALTPPNGNTLTTTCVPGPTWGPNDSFAYCIYDRGYSSYGFMPGPAGPARKLAATDNLVISDDGSTLVYHHGMPPELGDVVVESADGSGQRVLEPSVVEVQLHFTPDGQHVVADAELLDAVHVVVHAVRDGATMDLGPGSLFGAIDGGSLFSPDRSEVLAVLGDELVAVNVTTGAKRHFAAVGSDVIIEQAAFVDADHVIYLREQDTLIAQPDAYQATRSLRIASSSGETILVPDTDTQAYCSVQSVALAAGLATLGCDTASIVSFDGTVRATTARFALGISADARGIVTLADDGSVAFVTTAGQQHLLARATPRDQLSSPLLGPQAAYAP